MGAFFHASALAQKPDPAQAFATDWQGKAIAEGHVAESAKALLGAFQAQAAELKKAKDELAAYESRLATAMEWLKTAQAEAAAKR